MHEATARLLEHFERAKATRTALADELRAGAKRISQTRAELGNPFYYGGNTDHTDQLIDRYTGYQSHDAGLRLLRSFREANRRLRAIRTELLRRGVAVQ